MLTVRPDQVRALRLASLRRFEDEMVDHAQGFAPRLFDVIGADQMRSAVRLALANANGHGFSLRGPLRLCVEMVLLYGSGFDTDPQYPAVRAILDADRAQMQRAEEIFDHIATFQEDVAGPDAANVFAALKALSHKAREPDRYRLAELDAQLLDDMTTGFPRKAHYVGETGLRELIAEGRGAAERHGFSGARGQALIVTMMYAFGHRCIDDPLYPWISNTLTDPKIVDADSRAARLERKALTWLDHVLAAPRQG